MELDNLPRVQTHQFRLFCLLWKVRMDEKQTVGQVDPIQGLVCGQAGLP